MFGEMRPRPGSRSDHQLLRFEGMVFVLDSQLARVGRVVDDIHLVADKVQYHGVPGAVDKLPPAAAYDLQSTATAWALILLRAPDTKPLWHRASQKVYILL